MAHVETMGPFYSSAYYSVIMVEIVKDSFIIKLIDGEYAF